MKYRLIDNIAKALERIISFRIKEALANGEGLSPQQYGFREGRSTIDALLCVKTFVKRATDNKEVVAAIGIDIKNAFNTLPWEEIIAQMRRKRIPNYLIRLVRSYLSERYIWYKGSDGIFHSRKVFAGVPQGSVLGPLLWNLTYDWALEAPLWHSSMIVAYADDTLILAKGSTPKSAAAIASLSAGAVITRIQRLGLQVAAQKTEATIFCRRGSPPSIPIKIIDETVYTTDRIKHLGVILDRCLTFKAHLQYVEAKTYKVLRSLWRLMPNVRGPRGDKRRLYSNVLHSVMLYGAPVWSDTIMAYKSYRQLLLRIQRGIALRIISGYRTVSYEAALLLARTVPIHLQAARLRRIYERLNMIKYTNEDTLEEREEIKKASTVLMLRQWKLVLEAENLPGKRVRQAILPIYSRWMESRTCNFNYHVTQMITGHGSFGEYLHRIGKVQTPRCPFCNEIEVETPEHVVMECPF